VHLDQALAWLEDHVDLEKAASGGLGPPTLDRMRDLSAYVGDPQHAAPVVHVTGTNGKGSTVRMVTDLLLAHGLSVGTYTSPDLERVNERLARDGEPIDDDALADVLSSVADVEAATGVRPTRFEALTLAAFRWFADLAVDAVVLEVGMAGRWDATNVADATVAVVTNVALDHTAVLGPTRAHIAAEKAGIVKPASTLVLGETDPDLVPLFDGAASTWLRGEDFDCPGNDLAVGGRVVDLRTPGAAYDEVFLSLHGAHQGDNAAAAVAAAEAFFDRPSDDAVVREVLGSVAVPGRLEVVGRSPLVVLDGAHNAAGARAAAAALDDLDVGGDRLLVVGMSAGRDAEELLEALDARRARLVLACAPDWPRAMVPARVAEAAGGLGVEARAATSVTAAVDEALALAGPRDLVLVTGSLWVVGPARAHLRTNHGLPRHPA
jgi:dihydrofolate synthase/folylpolyglutamate synthase